jgi:hypothetical protein
VLGAAIAYQEVRDEFTSAAPKTPDWASLAALRPPAAVLGRACLYTLARSPGCDRSAAELAAELPALGVAQGKAKVRQVLRDAGPFTEVWRGRWQAGHGAPALLRYLNTPAATVGTCWHLPTHATARTQRLAIPPGPGPADR